MSMLDYAVTQPQMRDAVLETLGMSGIGNPDKMYNAVLENLVIDFLEYQDDLKAVREYQQRIENDEVVTYSADEVRKMLGL